MSARSTFLKMERRIAADERGGVIDRWRYGRRCLEAKAGRQQLPHGFTADRVAEAERAGLKLSEREIRRRVQCAEVYDSEAKVGQALADFGTWTALAEAGFPSVDSDAPDVEPDELEDIGEEDPEAVQDPLFDIPGFKPVLKLPGRKVILTEAAVRDALEYRDMVHEMHDNFGRTVAQIDATVEAMLEGCDGDLEANAVDAWKRATGYEDPEADDDATDDEDEIGGAS